MPTSWLTVVLLSSGHVKGGDVGVGSPLDEVVVDGSSEVSEVDEPDEGVSVEEVSAVTVMVTNLAAAVVVVPTVVVVRSKADRVTTLYLVSWHLIQR